MRVGKGTLGAAVGCLLLAMGGWQASAQVPINFVQTTADPPVLAPSTTPCTEQVIEHDFQNSYSAPAIGTLTPPVGCPAPWSKVVLSFSASVGGVQFDRLADVYVGDVNVFATSTSEPCCTPDATVSWTWQKDVSEYMPLLTASQTVTVFLNNVNDSTYTGVYHVVVTFTFYPTGAGAPAATHPDAIQAVDDMIESGGDGYFSLGSAGQQGSAQVTFPRNLDRLEAELFAQGHGPCEEFWWGDPDNCGVATPYREVDVYIDGQIAGAAPVYPVVFTGGDGPGLWEPIPSPRAWYVRPYTVDLSPFIGELVDGSPHTISLGVSDVVYGSGDYWLVGANLLEWLDAGLTQTSGSLTAVNAPVAATESQTEDPSGEGLGDLFSESHTLSFAGTVTDSGGTHSDSVSESITENTTEVAVSTDSSWDWMNNVTDDGSTRNSDSTYSIVNSSPASFSFSDANTTTNDGVSSSYTETMSTAAVGLALNGAECEAFEAQNYQGYTSYSRTLLAAGGEITGDASTYAPCSTATTPTASLPEVPFVPLLILVAVPAMFFFLRWRMRRHG